MTALFIYSHRASTALPAIIRYSSSLRFSGIRRFYSVSCCCPCCALLACHQCCFYMCVVCLFFIFFSSLISVLQHRYSAAHRTKNKHLLPQNNRANSVDFAKMFRALTATRRDNRGNTLTQPRTVPYYKMQYMALFPPISVV